jgi:6-phosphofructokinase 1
LKSARSEEFKTEEGRKKANESLKANDVDALVAIGGDGTFRGFTEFAKINPDIKAIGVPGTIDNDLTGTDFTLGFDTAVNTVIDAIDKIRDTADSHHRLFFIEVMGRDSGCIALWSGIAGGAEAILLPEQKITIDELISQLQEGAKKKKSSSIVIISEHNHLGSAQVIADKIKERFNFYDTRVTVLGHIQRGGSPTVFDRILGTRLGVRAVELLLEGESHKMVGIMKNKISLTDFSKATKQHSPLDKDLLKMRSILTI